MDSKLIFFPVIAQIILTFVLYVRLTIVKHRALENGEVDLGRRSLHGDAWPDSVLKVSNNLQNQFESPVLFYALCFMLWALDGVTITVMVLACFFVFLRALHAFVHTGSNIVNVRKNIFMASMVLLLILCGLALVNCLAKAVIPLA